MPIRLRTALLLALTLLLAACGGDDGGNGSEATATPTPGAAATAEATGCRKVEAPEPKPDGGLDKPTLKLDPAKAYTAAVVTSCGEFQIALDVKRAPKTSASFVHMAREGFYDDTTFHRIVPGFVIQGGDPKGEGTGGPGYSVVEAPPKDLQYLRGVVAMAKTGAERAGTSGSQFFVVTGEDAQLPPEYALLGRISDGDDVVERIATTPVDPATEQPVDPVVIESVTVSEK